MIFIARTSGISFQENLQFVLVSFKSFKNDSKQPSIDFKFRQ